MNAVRQEIRLSQEAAKRHSDSRGGGGTAHAAESLRSVQLVDKGAC